MRVALVLIALLVLSGSARADVFVPSDPVRPVREEVGACHASSGALEVSGKRTSRGWAIRVRDADGPWQRVTGLAECPSVDVTPGGTAVLAAGDAGAGLIVVRPPGGAFAAPIKLGGPPLVAISGEWIAAAWLGEDGDRLVLGALTIAPGGAVARAELDRFGDDALISLPAIAVDASGTAMLAWARATSDSASRRVRTARAVAGGAWAAGPDLPTDDFEHSLTDQFDLAVSPNGHTLVTWVTEDGVQASFDGEPYGTVGYASGAGSPQAAVNGAGDALIAFAARRNRVLVVDRPAGGGWRPARTISGTRGPFENNEEEDVGPREVDLSSVLAPDGRAVVAWTGAGGSHGEAVVAATGRPGGAWTAPVRLSSPVRWLGVWGLRFWPDGAPGVTWDEYEDDNRFYSLRRGARLVTDAQAPPPDRIAPVVSARLPTRAPATRTGEVSVRVRVRCSEACVARLELAGASAVRDLAAGATATLRAGFWSSGANHLLGRPGLRRLPVRLTVADRAGNVERRSSTLRVRVVRRSLRSFKVDADHDFAMFTNAGNRAVAGLVNSIIEGLASGAIRSERALVRRYEEGERAIERAGHDELGDTAVREEIYLALQTPLMLAGYPEALPT